MKKNKEKIKKEKRLRRKIRVRAKVKGTAKCPRLCVTRSLKHIFVQVIDDDSHKTLIIVKDSELNKKGEKKESGKITMAFEVGKLVAKKALTKKIEKVVFDKGACKYHGRVKAVAEGAREGGLKL